MNKGESGAQFTLLGKKLKALRAKANESLAETSGAVEIEARQLAEIELGRSRPTEDVLLLLISHFDTGDDEAVKLWEIAGYGKASSQELQAPATEVIVTAEDKILFTDVVDILVNNYGVVMNFKQSGGPGSKPTSVVRVGMSREHAKSVLQILQATMHQTEHNLPHMPGKLTAPESAEEPTVN